MPRFALRSWLRLVRWPNLLIVGGTQLVAWWQIIWPLHDRQALVLDGRGCLFICLSTMLIAAGGYIINDYFDIRIDLINKPDKVVLEREIPRRLAIIVHSVMNVLALALAAAVALPAGHPEWLLLQLLCTAMLWRYSTSWKRQFMTGNVVVSLMTALTVLTLALYEPALHRLNTDLPLLKGLRVSPLVLLSLFAFFAFSLTWMREIVKDMEDYKGDDAEGCVTMPIRWGLLRSSRFVQVIGGLTVLVLLLSLGWLCLQLHQPWRYLPLYLVSGTVVLPLALLCRRLPASATTEHYHRQSRRLKEIMVFGILALLSLTT